VAPAFAFARSNRTLDADSGTGSAVNPDYVWGLYGADCRARKMTPYRAERRDVVEQIREHREGRGLA
jgi:hypothetical protein